MNTAPIQLIGGSFVCFVATMTSCFAGVTPNGLPVCTHAGENDPVDEGWNSFVGPEASVYPTKGAWVVEDPSNEDNSVAEYWCNVSFCGIEKAIQYGWTIRACLAVEDPHPNPTLNHQSVFFGFNNLNKRFDAWFSETGDGVPTVTLLTGLDGCGVTGPIVELNADGGCWAPGSHYLELVCNPAGASADLFVDGVLAIEDYEGHTFGLSHTRGMAWGAGSSCGDGDAAFSLVEFVINDPHPVGDVNQDFSVDGADLGLLLSAWETADCESDLNFDEVVDGADLGMLLANWGSSGGRGACPNPSHSCVTTGSPGCSDASCCEAVCEFDPYCCEEWWDETCVGETVKLCD